jgi:hypothetical protein
VTTDTGPEPDDRRIPSTENEPTSISAFGSSTRNQRVNDVKGGSVDGDVAVAATPPDNFYSVLYFAFLE